MVLIFFLCVLPIRAQTGGTGGPDPLKILANVEVNQSYSTMSYEGKMEIFSGERQMTKTMKAWVSGSDKAAMEFTNPEDRGVRFLKLGNNLWMYFPKQRDTVKISGSLLRQGLMGSDVSYEDAMEPDSLSKQYAASYIRDEVVDSHACHVLELKTDDTKLTYAKRFLWIDIDKNIVWKAELYSRGGVLLKTTRTLAVTDLGKRHFPSIVEVSDNLKKNSRTVFSMSSLALNANIDASVFSLQALTR
jgi:outer membrane lipoprotein-sorting protein